MRRVTIHDVADAAGVSLATVDRVLNGRPGVRKTTIEKVKQAAETLNYKPDVFAAGLAKKRLYRLYFLLPNGPNAFMEDLTREALSHAETMSGDRMHVHIEPIDAFDGHRVAGTLAVIDRTVCDGVAVVAPAFPEVRAAIDRLQERGVPVVTLVSDHPSSTRRHFVGIDNIAAGRTAGRLLGRLVAARPGKIGLIAGSLGLRDHADRFFGCRQVIEADYPHLELLKVREGRDDNERNADLVRKLLDEHPDLAGLYNMGAGNRGTISALTASGRARDVVFVGHELTPYTRDALRADVLDAVIAQDPGHEIRSAIRVLKALCDGAAIIEGQERIGIDVFLKDNLPGDADTAEAAE
ncbi:LacI family DNA-binding transcriptional regulator [Roseibium salinum]|uniref:LacI family DNA-binding transcriptional regulator n=1 Tax=Roseibium salinum TaxID=1604349 RepID=A0ABT3R499_9HYPH|nr:LacI family DNA-binding transcriptional regulator [Roseibium sp. DSM 29163]MCX2724092.1 LacI family DNA-binding transcriptional regulator [Roseibium sp. DSM 29163]MDN3721842.1 LacI family DNA-binding transcriptional regulator [Roseibium salinum]